MRDSDSSTFWRVIGVIAVLACLGGMVVIDATYGRRPGAGHGAFSQISNQMRGILHGLVIYAQNHGDEFPAPDENWSKPLIDEGYIPVEMLKHPHPKLHDLPFCYYVKPPAPRLRWQSTLAPNEIVLVQNPATLADKGGFVGYTDNHVDYLLDPEFSRIVEELRDAGRLIGAAP